MVQFDNNHTAYMKIKQIGKQFEIKVSKIEISKIQNRTFNDHKIVLKQRKSGNKSEQTRNRQINQKEDTMFTVEVSTEKNKPNIRIKPF